MRYEDRQRQTLTFYALVVGILVLLNLISTRTFLRLDLTKTHAYSLSQVSKGYMRSLKDPLTVKAFFTKNLPAPYNANARYLRDLLDDYRTYSQGRFNYQFIDPADDPALEKEARSLGVYQVQLTAVARDKFEQKNGFMGVTFTYRDRKELIPLVQDTSALEYQISSVIKKLVDDKTRTIGVTQGSGEPSLYEDLDTFRQVVAKNYEVVPVDLANNVIPDSLDALIVAGPTQTLKEDKLYLLDHFLRSGKSLVVLNRMVKADIHAGMQGTRVDAGLNRLLTVWGVTVQPDLVEDYQCQKITVAQRGPGFIMQNIVPYPPFPLVSDLNKEHLTLKNIESLTLPFVSSLSLDEARFKNYKLSATVLARSSDKAWSQRGFFILSPQYIGPSTPPDFKKFDLAVAVTGAFPSAFTEAQVPKPSAPDQVLPPFQSTAKPSRLLVVGGPEFLANDFIDPRRGGVTVAQFAQNLVDWAAQDSALIEIRSKNVMPAALSQVSDLHRQAVKYFNWIGLPLVVALAGLLLWRRQQLRRLEIAARFRGQI